MVRRWELSWRERPPEEAAHFNPAFCGELISRTATGYHQGNGAAIPLALTFLVLPLVLHPVTRRALPGRSNTTFESWSAQNEDILVNVPERVLALRPITREALLFLTQLGSIDISSVGVALGRHPIRMPARMATATDETQEIRRKAGLIGRWFAFQPAPAAILQAMGVRI